MRIVYAMTGHRDITSVLGPIPYRLALAGGWIDQPFVSRLNPEPPGSMVVAALRLDCPFMERAGMATGTRKVARKLWPAGIPAGDRMALVRQLYAAENHGRVDPSGSQDMIGLVYPGICRLDYDAAHEGGWFPRHVECCNDRAIADWLGSILWVLPVGPRPEGYSPLEQQNLDPQWIRLLGRSGRDCYAAILARDAAALGASFNLTMRCWEALLPCVLRHRVLAADLPDLLAWYQRHYAGAMFSGCGGGYFYIVSDRPVPGAFQVRIRVEGEPLT